MLYITVINVISALSVVGLHTNGCFWTFSKESWWFSANIIESVLYFAVPLFFMVTGATLLDYKERYDTKTFFVRRFRKTVVPFLFWSFIGIVFRIYFEKNLTWSYLNVPYVVNGLFNRSFNTVYWFFPSLFSLYFAIPLFASIRQEQKIAVLKYLAVTCFFINYLIPFLITVFKLKIHFSIMVVVGSNYLLYLILGYLFRYINFTTRQKRIIYGMAFLGLLLHVCGTYVLSMEAGKVIRDYKGYNNVPCFLYSMGIYLLIKENANHINTLSSGRRLLGLKNYTFAIYLLHWYVMRVLVRVFEINVHLLVYRVGGIFVISIICVCLTYVIRKIPVIGKWILPA